ncbi:Zinc finger, RING-type [Corchorus olitorius]|uniref:RING-type E3 ubiquitin transferase n=1 Tax=Corchorus olitorius TaxID=93759 RepID=A0A1R3KFR5_9ROSI|nr:Zinc finger, RING-type [Corchorus olitorius]
MADPAQTRQPISLFLFITVDVGGEVDKPGPAPASKASIEALPTIKVEGSGKDCSICLEEFKINEEARQMPCKHFFHSNCVEKWLRIHGSCPVCRFLMPSEEESRAGGGASDGGDEGSRSLEGLVIGLGLGFISGSH